MNRVTGLFGVSLLMLGVLVAATLFRPTALPAQELTVAKIVEDISMMRGNDESILSVVLANHLPDDSYYRVEVTVDGRLSQDGAIVRPGSKYSYTLHIYDRDLSEGLVRVQVFKMRSLEPLDEAVYHLKKKPL